MSKPKQLKADINGKIYTFTFSKNLFSGGVELTVNRSPINLDIPFFQSFVGLDSPFTIAGKSCRLVILGKFADIAIDGKYIESGKEYVPLRKISWYSWLFVILSIAAPIVTLGGIISFAAAIASCIVCIRLSVSPETTLMKRLLLSLVSVVVTWAVAVLYVILLGILAQAAA